MSNDTEVVGVETRTTETGLEVQISVARSFSRIIIRPMRPEPQDVPQDVRDALARWLAQA